MYKLVNHSVRVLAVENDPVLSELLAEIFTDAGFEFQLHASADDLILTVADFEPNVILLDYLLGKLSGGDYCKMLKGHPLYQNIPVIVYSALPTSYFADKDYGCDLFLAKPFDIDELLSEISRLALA